MRRAFGFPVGTQVLSLFRADADLKAHPRYRLAKEGDQTAALDLVIDLAVPWLFANEHRFSNVPCIFVAPHAKEASGDNAIAQTLAAVCAAVLKGVPRSKDVRLIQERFQHEFVHIFNIEPAALTANEAGYLVDFKSVDAIRNRRAKAEQEIDRRLRSKGIARALGGTAAPTAHQQSGLTPPVASLKPNPPTRTPGTS